MQHTDRQGVGRGGLASGDRRPWHVRLLWDMLLEALAACAGVTMAAVATSIGVDLRGGTVRAEGDLDFRGTLGVAKDVPVGFQQIRLAFELDADASAEQLANLRRLTERYCVVYQTLRHTPAISVSLNGQIDS